MPRTDFRALPDDARLWVFGTERPLSESESRTLLASVDDFLDGWAAHGSPLVAAREWVEDQFLLVGLDERSVPPSGCSIDAMVRHLKALEGHLGMKLVDNAPVYLRSSEDRVERVSRSAFRDRARRGEVTPETRVFDTTLTRVGAFREGRFEVEAARSWHGAAFFG